MIRRCRDCLCKEGELHEPGCDHEQCSKCGRQVLGWGKCPGAKPEPFFEFVFPCKRCGTINSSGRMVKDEEWEFICGGTYDPNNCILCNKCMDFIIKKRGEINNGVE